MDAFIRNNQDFMMSLLYLVFGIWLFGYSIIDVRHENSQRQATAVLNELNREKTELDAITKKRDQEKKANEAGSLQSLPSFLGHINSIASQTKVIIRELSPAQDKSLKFNLKITTDYFTFLRFMSELEALNVIVNDVQIHPYDSRKTPPEHAIEFSITPRGNGEPLPNANERIKALRDQVGEPGKRNPFQRFAFNKDKMQVTRDIELTWLYRLTGIGRIGDKRMATINAQDYSTGDSFDGMTITAIETDRVRLEKKSAEGTTSYILKFRPVQNKQ